MSSGKNTSLNKKLTFTLLSVLSASCLFINNAQASSHTKKTLCSVTPVHLRHFQSIPFLHSHHWLKVGNVNPKLHQTLKKVLSQTLISNPTVLKTEADALAARSAVGVARGGLLPSVDFTAGIGRETTNSVTRSDEDGALTRVERQLTVSQLLWDDWGTLNQVRSRKYQYQASRLQTAEQKELTALRVTEVYLDTLRFQKLVQLSKSNVIVHKETLRKVTLRYKGGAGHKADSDLADSRLAQSISTLLATEGSLTDARAAYKNVTDMTPRGLHNPRVPHLPHSLKSALVMGNAMSPALQVAKKNIRAALANIKVSKAAFYPRVSVEGAITRNKNIDGLFARSDDEYGMLMLRYNVFNGGSDVAGVRQAVFNYDSAFETYAEVKRTVKENITSAWNNYRIATRRVRELDRRVRNTRLVLTAYQKQFELGQRSLLNLVDTERELFNARNDLINSRFLVKTSAYRLLASVGNLEHKITSS